MTVSRPWLALLAAVAMPGLALAQEAPHWDYEEDEAGPGHWGELSKDFGACASGREQSPIDLTRTIDADAPDVVVDWNAEAVWTIVNTGHTIQANAEDGGTITLDGKAFDLLQFHFHNPSEHAIEGERFPMEAHFVHRAEDGTLAVVGVMLVGGGESDFLDKVMAAAPAEEGEKGLGVADPGAFLPPDGHYFRYEGSLTTPPCSETVDWTVMRTPVAVPDADLAAFHALFPMNARPLQLVNRRFVLSE